MYLLFDIGGTNLRIGFSVNGKTMAMSRVIPTPKGFSEGIRIIKQISDEMSGGGKITGAAGGIAGPLDREKTMLLKSPHIPGWIGKPLKSELERILGCRAVLENDTAMEGIGEAKNGAGGGKNIVVFITVGTGVGGVRITGGQIDKNALGFEPGHQIIVPDGNSCNCGGRGHLETYVGGSYLEKIYHQKGEEIIDQNIWDEVSRYLAIGLTNVCVHWSPEIIVLGGSVSQSIPLDKVRAYLKEFLTIFPEPPQTVKAALGNQAGLYGALELLK